MRRLQPQITGAYDVALVADDQGLIERVSPYLAPVLEVLGVAKGDHTHYLIPHVLWEIFNCSMCHGSTLAIWGMSVRSLVSNLEEKKKKRTKLSPMNAAG